MEPKKSYLDHIISIIILISVLISVTPAVQAQNPIPGNTDNASKANVNRQAFIPIANASGAPDAQGWPMVGANIERTSWTPEQVDGELRPLWSKQFEPYIPPKVQIIAAYNTLYISTSAGLYALDSATGVQKWVFPTEMPLGDSPTIYKGVAYVGGHDKRLYAVNASTGQKLWSFTAAEGFSASPLVVAGMIYIGNRDGYFYAIHAAGPQVGQMAWKYKTDGQIDFSAAYKDGVIYFASDDSFAYALDTTGHLVWKSIKLPGAGFHSWWPVIYRDWVIFPGSTNSRLDFDFKTEYDDVYPHKSSDPRGTLVGPSGTVLGDWVAGTQTIDTSKPNITANGATVPITEYLETKPWRRTYFVLNRATGLEYTTDFDHDGKPEYAPFLWYGTWSGNRYPPVVGSDNVIYQSNNFKSDPYIPGGQVSGWQIGTPYISIISSDWGAVDESLAYSAGGNRIYWNKCCDRESGSYDISKAQWVWPREVQYYNYNLNNLIPNYWTRVYPNSDGDATFGGLNGIYGPVGDQNPPVPYLGKVYSLRSNAVLAFGNGGGQPVTLPMSTKVTVTDPNITIPTPTQVRASLTQEVEKMLTAGHLRPGFFSNGAWSYEAVTRACGDRLSDYWHNPADTIYTLIRALPYLSVDLQTRTKAYLQAEFTAYPLYSYSNIGWKDGASREIFILPPDVDAARAKFPPTLGTSKFLGWNYDPFGFYAMWKYAEVFGNAKNIFDASKNLLNTLPADDYLISKPQVNNAYIAGYFGYLGLQNMAGYPESANIRQDLNRLLHLRATTFSKDGIPLNPNGDYDDYCRGLNVSRNFLYLVPELGQYLHDYALNKVQQALTEYSQISPYWFVSSFDAVFSEGATSILYDHHALFQAKSLVFFQTRQELAKYLDIPAVAVGDLFYIDNLIATIEAEGR